jgi:hypothetical protein
VMCVRHDRNSFPRSGTAVEGERHGSLATTTRGPPKPPNGQAVAVCSFTSREFKQTAAST